MVLLRRKLSEALSHEYIDKFRPDIPANAVDIQTTVWVRFQLQTAATPHEWYLLLEHPIGNTIDVFTAPDHRHVKIYRLPDYTLPVFKLDSNARETVTVYLRINNGKAKLSLPLQLTLLTGEQLLDKIRSRTFLLGSLWSAMMMLAVYNLLLFFSMGELAYLSLALFVGFANLLFLRDSGIFLELPWIHDTSSYFYSVPILLGMASGFHYWKYINRGASRLMEYLCLWIPRLSLLAIPLSGLLDNMETLLFSLALILVPIVLTASTLAALRGHSMTRETYWFLLILLIGVTPYLLMKIGYSRYDVNTLYFTQSCMLLSLVLLSFSQTQQTRHMRDRQVELEAGTKTRDEFIATMSHELRTPINALVGINALLSETPLTSEQQECVKRLEASSGNMMRLVDEVLDLSRIQQAEIALTYNPFYLEDLLNELRQMFSVLAEHKGLSLNILPTASQTTQLEGDTSRLSQVLTNLLGNAIKYTEQGVITLKTQINHQDKSSVTLLFEVIDTGIGIAPAHLPHLFEPFYQASRKQHRSSSGLGLAISHKLVSCMGGVLSVESTENQGSRFHFTLKLPIYQQTDKQSTIQSNNPVSLDKLQDKQILMVDDDEINLFVSKKIFTRYGTKLTTATNSEEALQQLEQQSFDLIIMDITLPDQSGFETAKQIRQDGRFGQMPIIAISAHTLPEIRNRCLATGMNDFIGKPFKLDQLLAMSARWLP